MSHALQQNLARRLLPCRGRGRRRHRRRRRAAAGRRRSGSSRASSRATDACGISCSTSRAAACSGTSICWCPPKDPSRADGLHHHGARGHAADVGLELDLRRHGAARQRHPADAGARDAPHPGGAGRADRGGRAVPRRQGRTHHRAQRALLRRQTRRGRSKSPASARSKVDTPMAATVSSSSTPQNSASRSVPTRRATSPNSA